MTTSEHEPESKVRIACLQMEPQVGEKDRNLAHCLEMIDQAAEAGANLVVLPELCNSGYVFNTREEAHGLAEKVPDGAPCRAWAEAAARHKMPIADANLSVARRKRRWNDFNQVRRDRRIDLYAEDLGTGIQRGWY